ncbi:Metallo-dependent phosphatase [Phellopilus nigrolimitatus]|nr:Metallo-dependent phosphatase [Phellopilus nigrolimitatus]
MLLLASSVLLAFATRYAVPAVGALPAAAPREPVALAIERAATASSADVPDPYPDKPRVTFNSNGTFKITVFSDLHFGENPWDAWGPEQDVNSTRLMRTVLADEKPDYVVLNGDLITGESELNSPLLLALLVSEIDLPDTFRENSTKLIDEIMVPINEAQVKFSSTYGNHDNEANITHLEEIKRELLVAPRSYTRVAPPGIGGEEGPGTYWVPVYTKESDSAPSLILWFFDSRGGFSEGTGATAVPDWVDSTVAGWIESESAAMNAAWGPAENRGALAFVHIPPHTIQALQPGLNSTQDPGLNADLLGSGSTQATTAASSAGNDDPFWDALNANVKNLHAVISGHDHGNEWCVREPTKDVIFCFDKHSGYGGYSSAGWGHGVRNVVFSSPDPTGALDTWIRLEDGETRAKVTLDSNYQ